MDENRTRITLQNAIIMLEEMDYAPEEIQDELDISEQDYKEIMQWE